MTGDAASLRARLSKALSALERVDTFAADLRTLGFPVAVSIEGAPLDVTVNIIVIADAQPNQVKDALRTPDKAPALAKPEESASKPVALKTGPWTDIELAELERLHAKGESAAQIGRTLRRSAQGVGAMIGHLKARKGAATKDVAPSPTPVIDAPQAVVDEPQPAPEVPQAEASKAASTPWSAAEDLALVEGLARGRKLPTIAADLGREVYKCRARFRDLLPSPTMESQAKLLKWLRVQVSAEGAT